MSISIKDGTSFEAGIPAPMFEIFVPSTSLAGNRNYYVVAHNGQKFLVCNFTEKESARPINVVTNWKTALKDK